jgi:hypothetical protein
MKSPRPRSLALLGAAAAFALSCTEPTPLGVPERDLIGLTGVTATVQVPPNLNLLACTPLAADSMTATVGPAGGTLQAGPHTLVIPPDALDRTVTITMVAPSDTVNRVQFQPAGLQFQQPASLTLSYANCNVLGIALPRQIVYTTDSLVILEVEKSADDALSATVTSPLKHFSDYAVAW